MQLIHGHFTTEGTYGHFITDTRTETIDFNIFIAFFLELFSINLNILLLVALFHFSILYECFCCKYAALFMALKFKHGKYFKKIDTKKIGKMHRNLGIS